MRCILVHIIPYYYLIIPISHHYHTIIHYYPYYYLSYSYYPSYHYIIICRWVPDVNFLYYSVNYLVVSEVKVRKRTSFAALYT
jgi:hypothetical protein